jgi:hypothetical protein
MFTKKDILPSDIHYSRILGDEGIERLFWSELSLLSIDCPKKKSSTVLKRAFLFINIF